MTDYVLNIKAVEAEDLPKMDLGTFTCDGYLSFRTSSSKKTYKTKYIKQTYNPKWNETFAIPINLEHDESLHVELYDHDHLSHDDLISTHDFQIGFLPLGKIVDTWYTFFAARNVEKPGKVHLVFHLANKGDTPFKEKVYDNERNRSLSIDVQPLSAKEMDEAQYCFSCIDRDQNGYIDEKELDTYFERNKPELRCFPKLVIEFFGKNGHITIDQYFAFYKALAADKDSDQFLGKVIFDKIDKDHSGVIDAEEFEKVMSLLKFPDCYKRSQIQGGSMDYARFSKEFFDNIKKVWLGIYKPIM